MKSIQEMLSGTTWGLESFQSEDKNGSIIYPLGKDAKGYIMFLPGNRISVHIMAAERDIKGRPNLPKMDFLTEEESKMAEFGYHAYSGPFDIDEAEKLLTTHIKVSLVNSYVGSDQPRKVELKGDKLYLSNANHPERKLVWRKLEA